MEKIEDGRERDRSKTRKLRWIHRSRKRDRKSREGRSVWEEAEKNREDRKN